MVPHINLLNFNLTIMVPYDPMLLQRVHYKRNEHPFRANEN